MGSFARYYSTVKLCRNDEGRYAECRSWVSSGLTNKYKIRLQTLANGKHASLFRQIVNDKKGFTTSTPGPNVIKLFTFIF
jgi:hypothetical protein